MTIMTTMGAGSSMMPENFRMTGMKQMMPMQTTEGKTDPSLSPRAIMMIPNTMANASTAVNLREIMLPPPGGNRSCRDRGASDGGRRP